MTTIRKGQAPDMLDRKAFHERFVVRFFDPAFDAERDAIARLEDIAWDAYREGRKAPATRKAGVGFADPAYDLSVEWLDTRDRLAAAQAAWGDASHALARADRLRQRRNDGTCPGEMSKAWRLTNIAREVVQAAGVTPTCST